MPPQLPGHQRGPPPASLPPSPHRARTRSHTPPGRAGAGAGPFKPGSGALPGRQLWEVNASSLPHLRRAQTLKGQGPRSPPPQLPAGAVAETPQAQCKQRPRLRAPDAAPRPARRPPRPRPPAKARFNPCFPGTRTQWRSPSSPCGAPAFLKGCRMLACTCQKRGSPDRPGIRATPHSPTLERGSPGEWARAKAQRQPAQDGRAGGRKERWPGSCASKQPTTHGGRGRGAPTLATKCKKEKPAAQSVQSLQLPAPGIGSAPPWSFRGLSPFSALRRSPFPTGPCAQGGGQGEAPS